MMFPMANPVLAPNVHNLVDYNVIKHKGTGQPQ